MSSQTLAIASSRPARPDKPPRQAPSRKADILLISGLLLLGLIPAIAGQVRLFELFTGGEITADNVRFFNQPFPFVVHIVAATLYAFLGAFQFSALIRRRFINWHRRAGRMLAVCGLLLASTGLWMSLFYDLPASDGILLLVFRLVFGIAMIVALVLGIVAVLRRNLQQHRAWMIRAYAIAMAAGTQVFAQLPWIMLFGMPGEWTRGWLMAAGWIINVAVAEIIIRRQTQL
ncbi:MAG: DUF2306 domain-containing protein [Natronospirillum sp.]